MADKVNKKATTKDKTITFCKIIPYRVVYMYFFS